MRIINFQNILNMNRIFIAMLIGCTVATLVSCGSRSVRGNGNVVTSNRDEGSFDAVSLAGPLNVYLLQGSEHSIRIEAEENLLNYIITDVKDDVLRVKLPNGVRIRPKKPVQVYVTAPAFSKLLVAGSGSIKAERTLIADGNLRLEITGSGDIRVPDVDAPEVILSLIHI